MKKRLCIILLIVSLISVSASDIRAMDVDDAVDSVATASDAQNIIDDEKTYDSSYIDINDRIDMYEPVSDTFMLNNSVIPTYYDARENGVVTSVKNQNPYGTCWAFAALAAGETSLLSNGYSSEVDLSEYQLAYFFFNAVNDPLGNLEGDNTYINPNINENYLSVGGNNYFTMFCLASWRGAADESVAPYQNAKPESVLDDTLAYNDIAHLQNAYIVSMKNKTDVKKMIMEYGSVASGFYIDLNNYNYSTNGYYQSEKSSSNHAITIIGWDDNYSVDKFNEENMPSSPGAWLIRNSWGEYSAPYIWVSYEDVSLANQDAFAFIMEDADNYDNNYQYDGTNIHAYSEIENGQSLANVYTASAAEEEQIEAVSIALRSDNVKYSVQIYKNSDSDNPESWEAMLKSEIEGQTTYAGYYTIKVPEMIRVNTGDKFSIVFTLTDVDSTDGKVQYYIDKSGSVSNKICFTNYSEEGQSFYTWSNGIVDTAKYNECARIKAFTTDVNKTPDEEQISLDLCDIGDVATQYYTGKGITPNVNIKYNGEVLKKNTDYVLSYNNNVNLGSATLIINGIGNYTGSRMITFTILAKRNPTTIYNGVDYSAVYDYNYYVFKYPDIWKAFGTDDYSTLKHFVTCGVNECRQGNAEFDVLSYLYLYSDLRRAYGGNYAQYYMHYINYGKTEGRTAIGITYMVDPITVYNGVDYSDVYDFKYYINKYNDLARVYWYDDAGALKHFVTYGMAEKRQGCLDFNVDSYAQRYADLRHVYKNNMKEYYMHYIKYGKIENRKAKGNCNMVDYNTIYQGVDYSLVYDYNYYVKLHNDIYGVYGYDEDAVLKHFVLYGMKEGRRASDTFDVFAYRSRYVDLQRAFGNDMKKYYLHYLNYGVYEKRISI